jgi:hypothetical protein
MKRKSLPDADGYFKIGKLPGGDLTILFEKKGYKIHHKELVNTKEGMVYRVTLDMLPREDDDDNEDLTHPLYRLSGENRVPDFSPEVPDI